MQDLIYAPHPSLERELTHDSKDKYGLFRAINPSSAYEADAMEFLCNVTDAVSRGDLTKADQSEVKRIMLERGLHASQTELAARLGGLAPRDRPTTTTTHPDPFFGAEFMDDDVAAAAEADQWLREDQDRDFQAIIIAKHHLDLVAGRAFLWCL